MVVESNLVEDGITFINSAVDVTVRYTTFLDYIVLVMDVLSLIAVSIRIFAYDPVKNAAVYRIGLTLLAFALAMQSVRIVYRQILDTPFDPDFQSSWALKDIAIFVLTFTLVYREWRARQIMPTNEGSTDFKKRDSDIHQR